MTSGVINPPSLGVIAGTYDLDLFRTTPVVGVRYRFPVGSASGDGWDVPFPIKVTRLNFSLFINSVGVTTGAIRCQAYKNVIDSGNLILKVEYFQPTTGWQYGRDSAVNNSGQEFLDAGDTLIVRVVCKPGSTNTSFSNYSAVVDYEVLG